jgi:hypothetical protein
LIQIESRWEGEETKQVLVEEVMHDTLGLRKEDERMSKLREEACNTSIPNDLVVLCDWRNIVMSLGSRYKDMVTFRLAIRQYVIKREFKLDIQAISTTKFRGYYQGCDCPRKIHATIELIGSPTIIICIRFFAHFSVSYID